MASRKKRNKQKNGKLKYIKTFLDTYRALIPIDLYFELSGMEARGKETAYISQSDYDCIKRKWEDNQEADKDYDETSELRLQGMELENAGDTDGAIETYIRCIQKGESSRFNILGSYGYAYQRLITCLRKQGKRNEEAGYIRKFIALDISSKEKAKYTARLERLERAIDKARK